MLYLLKINILFISMNKKTLLTLTVAGTVAACMAAKKDPVVMNVAGKDVHRSEFEYLYHKNANQQVQPQSIEEYAEMFKLYKLKVADALAEGIDTTASFRNEYAGYLVELRAPYCVDSVYVKELMAEAYDRMRSEVQVNHIMVLKPRGLEKGSDIYSLADSLHTELMNGADFATLAKQYSGDKGSAMRGGNMGWITALMTPYEFETAAYNLPEGQISDIVETDYGYHILKGGAKRPARGEVSVAHILLMLKKDASAEQQAAVQAKIDSLYNVAIEPASNFEALAVKYSEDPGSARQGGKLPWFGVGRMVPEFDSVAFALPKGGVSAPFRTDFGYHIIKKLDARDIPDYAAAEPRLRQAMDNRSDTRGRWKARQFAEKLRKQYKFKYDKKIRETMLEYVAEHGMHPEFCDHFASMADKPYMSFADKKFTVGDFLAHMARYRNNSYPSTGKKDLQTRFESFEQKELYNYYLDRLPEMNADFRNLINEYRDGMLLFEISNRKVWDKAAKDTVGLKAFFEKNRADYTWKSPRVKGILVQAANDSVAKVATAMLDTLPADKAIHEVRKELGTNIKVDRILMSKGDNELVDALIFDMKELPNPNTRYPKYFIYNAKMLNAPEEVDDVKAQATADYQNALETEWIEELQSKYPVIINEKELNKIK